MVQGHLSKRREYEIFQSMDNVQKHNGKTKSEACGNMYTKNIIREKAYILKIPCILYICSRYNENTCKPGLTVISDRRVP